MPILDGEDEDEHLPCETEVLPPESSLNKAESEGMSVSYREGPISPSELREYDQLYPGFAKDYLREILEGATHSRKIQIEEIELEKANLAFNVEIVKVEERIFNSNQARSTLGTILGSIIALAAIGGATFLGSQSYQNAAIAVAGSLPVAVLAIYGTDAYNKNKQKHLEATASNNKITKTQSPSN